MYWWSIANHAEFARLSAYYPIRIGLVADFYQKLGFASGARSTEGAQQWSYDLPQEPGKEVALHPHYGEASKYDRRQHFSAGCSKRSLPSHESSVMNLDTSKKEEALCRVLSPLGSGQTA